MRTLQLVPRSKITGMLAKRREIKHAGVVIERTPLLVPSFSSKGFPDVRKIIATTEQVIEGPTLISAYDLHYQYISPPFDFASLVFVDSGGYEASKDSDLAELTDYEYEPREWNQDLHDLVLETWSSRSPTVLISFDKPGDRIPLAEQIRRARRLAPKRTDVMRELLLKPETRAQRLLDMESVVKSVKSFGSFDVIGVTEKEIGNSILTRMANIARLRQAMDKHGLDLPIHVFGSLDTVTTPMYFLAGADIFDGLTWLRFAYYNGFTMYKQNYGALELGVTTGAHIIDGRCWYHNYGYLTDLQLEMRRFLNNRDYASFKFPGDLFERAVGGMEESIRG